MYFCKHYHNITRNDFCLGTTVVRVKYEILFSFLAHSVDEGVYAWWYFTWPSSQYCLIPDFTITIAWPQFIGKMKVFSFLLQYIAENCGEYKGPVWDQGKPMPTSHLLLLFSHLYIFVLPGFYFVCSHATDIIFLLCWWRILYSVQRSHWSLTGLWKDKLYSVLNNFLWIASDIDWKPSVLHTFS